MSAARNVSDQPASASSPTILVVEDEILVRAVAAANLRDRGFDVVEVGNADEAICILKAGFRVDIVFSDVNMPGSLDGFGLALRLRRERPDLKIILTSCAPPIAHDASVAHGPILAKPYDHAALAHQLRTLTRP